jgi:murein DD-endopeptidase MepM/ murein hydrolase activator NlpD
MVRSYRLPTGRRRQLSVLVIPDDGSRTLEFKLSYWMLRLVTGILILLVVLLLVGGRYYWLSRSWERVAQLHKRENSRLRAEVERVEELASMVTRMKEVDQQLRSMLSPNLSLPPSSYTTSPTTEALFDGSVASEKVATLKIRPAAYRQDTLDPRRVPSVWPIPRSIGFVTAEFEDYRGVLKNQHLGIDIAAPEGATVHATADGKVVFSDVHADLGRMVAIDHFGVYLTRYGHNSLLLIEVGEHVRKGQPVAMVGNTGHSSGPHLHYEVLERGEPRDPRQFLP